MAFFLFGLNTFIFCHLLFSAAFIKVLVPFKKGRNKISQFLVFISFQWIKVNSFIFLWTQKIKLDVQGLEKLDLHKSYLVISNHRSWVDIFVLQHLFRGKIPFLKFFLKKELIWVPVLGLAWWALDFPFLKRYSKSFLAKHPKLRGKDIETTKKCCEKFKDFPISVMNFVEGTRFDWEKHKQQQSPYRHLLRPSAGGVALVLANMGEFLEKIIDVTIIYPHNNPPVKFWDLLSGRIDQIVVRVKSLSIPSQLLESKSESDFQKKSRAWINLLWEEKDQEIEKLSVP